MNPLMITGISGFIGGQVWKKIGHREDALGVYGSKGKVPYHEDRQFGADLKNPFALRNSVLEIKPRCILHLAAISSPAYCAKNEAEAMAVNYQTVHYLSETADQVGARLIFASSDQVFSGKKGLYTEKDEPHPLNFYGMLKLKAEADVIDHCQDSVVARINNTYGPPGFGGDDSFSEWIIKRAEKGEKIPLFVDQYRSPIDVETLASALIELLDHDYKGIIHLGGANRLSRINFGKILLDKLHLDSNLILETESKNIDPEGTMPRDTSYDISLAKKNFKLQVSGNNRWNHLSLSSRLLKFIKMSKVSLKIKKYFWFFAAFNG